jgi:hypothetical protein
MSAHTLSSMQQVIAGKKAIAECDGGAQREADSTEKQQLKEPLEQHYEQHMEAEQNSEDAQRHTDGAESKWRMVLEREADVQTFEQMSELHTTEHRVAAISIAGVLAIMIVAAYCTAAEGSWRSAVAAYCTHVSKYPSMAVEDCPWRGAADSLLDNLACCYGFDGWGHGFGSRNRNYMKM